MKTAVDKLIQQQRILNDTFENWYTHRYQEPIGPVRRNAIKISKLIKNCK
jgi:hypothetical protein